MTENANLFLLDRSGSMRAILDNTIAMFNNYKRELAEKNPSLPFTLVQFDSTSEDTLAHRVPIASVPDLTEETFQPRHGTPLLAALGGMLRRAMRDYKPEDRVVITVLSDGADTGSPGFTRQGVAELIRDVTVMGWQVIFLGASFDVYQEGHGLGISRASTMSYDAHSRGSSLRASGIVGQSVNSFYETGKTAAFSDEDKASVGDIYQTIKAKDKP